MKTLLSLAYIVIITICIYVVSYQHPGLIGFALTLGLAIKLFISLLCLHFPSKK